jgi:hypothetical protein
MAAATKFKYIFAILLSKIITKSGFLGTVIFLSAKTTLKSQTYSHRPLISHTHEFTTPTLALTVLSP